MTTKKKDASLWIVDTLTKSTYFLAMKKMEGADGLAKKYLEIVV